MLRNTNHFCDAIIEDKFKKDSVSPIFLFMFWSPPKLKSSFVNQSVLLFKTYKQKLIHFPSASSAEPSGIPADSQPK